MAAPCNDLQIAGQYSGDGYDYMGEAEKLGWHALSGWGKDGWDLLDWPYYICFIRVRKENPSYEVGTYCEHDLTYHVFTEEREFYAHIDQLALWSWRHHSEPWITEYAEGEEPDYLKGPYAKDERRAALGYGADVREDPVANQDGRVRR